NNLPSTFANSSDVRQLEGLFYPEGATAPLPTGVQVDSDGNFEVTNVDIFTVDGLEATLAALGILVPQSASTLQFPGSGTFNYIEQQRTDGEEEWDEEYLTVSWERGEVLIGNTPIPALIMTVTEGESLWFDEKEMFTIANGWIWWMSEVPFMGDDDGFGDDDDWGFILSANGSGATLPVVQDIVPFLPLNVSAGDAFHYDFSADLGLFSVTARVAWQVASLSATTPDGEFSETLQIKGRTGGTVKSIFGNGTMSSEFTHYYKSGHGLVYMHEIEKDKFDGEPEEITEHIIKVGSNPMAVDF
ncbi:MAG: hypothetical protein EA401_01830, partial [Planctomycetota bacterium]